jgi:hypothetical protein
MAQQRSAGDSLVRSELSAARADEAEPVVKTGSGGKGNSSTRQPPRESTSYPVYRRLCDETFKELERIDAFIVEGEVSDEGMEVVAEVEALLEQLYACPYGQGESLKRVVVALQSQVNNARWDRRHIDFLRDVVRYLRVRYLVDEATVGACYDMMKAHGLDEFRGTIGAPWVVKRYRIEEVKDNDESNRTAP